MTVRSRAVGDVRLAPDLVEPVADSGDVLGGRSRPHHDDHAPDCARSVRAHRTASTQGWQLPDRYSPTQVGSFGVGTVLRTLTAMPTILVTGAATWVGGRLVQRLEARPGTTVVPVDELSPRVAFTTPLLKASLDTLEFARSVIDLRPDVVIHLQTLDRIAELGRVRSREGMVLGAQALFGAISRVRHGTPGRGQVGHRHLRCRALVILRSSTRRQRSQNGPPTATSGTWRRWSGSSPTSPGGCPRSTSPCSASWGSSATPSGTGYRITYECRPSRPSSVGTHVSN